MLSVEDPLKALPGTPNTFTDTGHLMLIKASPDFPLTRVRCPTCPPDPLAGPPANAPPDPHPPALEWPPLRPSEIYVKHYDWHRNAKQLLCTRNRPPSIDKGHLLLGHRSGTTCGKGESGHTCEPSASMLKKPVAVHRSGSLARWGNLRM